MNPIKILLADADEEFRLVLEKLISNEPDMTVCLSTDHAEKALDYLAENSVDVLKLSEAEWKALMDSIDVLVDGRFEKDQRSLDVKWRGSKNQRLIDVQASLKEGKAVEKALE